MAQPVTQQQFDQAELALADFAIIQSPNNAQITAAFRNQQIVTRWQSQQSQAAIQNLLAQLGQATATVTTLNGTITTLQQQQQQAQQPQQVTQMSQQQLQTLIQSIPAPAAAAGPAAPANVRIAAPEPFKGERTNGRAFLQKMSLYFQMHPNNFTTDEEKIRYIVLLCDGVAANWAAPIQGHFLNPPVTGLPPICTTWATFETAFRLSFYDPDEVRTVTAQLKRLSQEKMSAVDYAAEWRRLISILGWTQEGPLMDSFRSGLKDRVKDSLAEMEDPLNVEELIARTIRIDNRQWQRLQEKKGKEGTTTSGGQKSVQSSKPTTSTTSSTSATTTKTYSGAAKTTTTPTTKAPVQIKQEPVNAVRGRISAEERERRFKGGLCLVCGQAGHRRSNCPHAKPRVAAISAEASVIDDGEDWLGQSNNPFLKKDFA